MKLWGREGADRRTAERYYVEVVQVVFLFGSETWVMNTHPEKTFEGFYHQAVQGMEGIDLKR